MPEDREGRKARSSSRVMASAHRSLFFPSRRLAADCGELTIVPNGDCGTQQALRGHTRHSCWPVVRERRVNCRRLHSEFQFDQQTMESLHRGPIAKRLSVDENWEILVWSCGSESGCAASLTPSLEIPAKMAVQATHLTRSAPMAGFCMAWNRRGITNR